jgi:hypothetical protein
VGSQLKVIKSKARHDEGGLYREADMEHQTCSRYKMPTGISLELTVRDPNKKTLQVPIEIL